MTTLRALALTCSLKKSPAPSSAEKLAREILTALADHSVDGEVVRVVDHDVRFGVSTDEVTATSGRPSGPSCWTPTSLYW
ncbi:hypothetical protein [Tenggerimyces flavus]|uniref:Uncharacterized protein n=1 Tax=Tenggerimyces flavus TaxID=1708749 RepID=A0ABV7Y345_9ACTN|nr:hypothetical protein [Tenggerimyces flavus]MBM7790360.1 hypothetical protein [Tenggerimyces flavus]